MNLFNFFFHTHNEIAVKGADKVLSSGEENSSVQKTYVNFPTSRKSALGVPLYAISSGRSMVEMLGVLAIVGVLSVGAIAGYSKAMLKYKLNKQTEQMNTIINAVIRYYNDLKLNNESLIPLLKKLREIPEDMYIKNNENYIKDVFGVQYRIYYHNTGYIGILSTISNRKDRMEVCQNLYSIAKTYHTSIGAVLSKTQTELTGSESNYVFGDKECTANNTCLINMNISDIIDRCRICEDADECLFYYIFR